LKNRRGEIIPSVAKVEDIAGPRHQGRSCNRLPQGLDNAGNAVSSAFLTCWVVAESEAQKVNNTSKKHFHWMLPTVKSYDSYSNQRKAFVQEV